MHPHLRLPTWEELSPGSQEVHRSRQDYLLPTLIPTVINLAASVTNIMAA